MSFTNPAVFKAVQDSVGQEVEVEVTENDAGYNQWVSVGGVGSVPPAKEAVPAVPSSPLLTRASLDRIMKRQQNVLRNKFILSSSHHYLRLSRSQKRIRQKQVQKKSLLIAQTSR